MRVPGSSADSLQYECSMIQLFSSITFQNNVPLEPYFAKWFNVPLELSVHEGRTSRRKPEGWESVKIAII